MHKPNALNKAEEFAGIKFDATRSTSIDNITVQVKTRKRSLGERDICTQESQPSSKGPKLSNEIKIIQRASESTPAQIQVLLLSITV